MRRIHCCRATTSKTTGGRSVSRIRTRSAENWITRSGRYSPFYRSTLKSFPRLNSSLDPCPELCRCRRCKTQLFKRAGAAKSVARCSVERTLANPGSLMESVGKEGEKMERRKGICFFVLGDTRVSIVESIDRSIVMHHGSRKLRYKFPLSSRTPPLHSGDRMLHFAPDSRLTLQLFRNAIIVTRCLELRKPSPLSSPVLSRAYASPQRE